MRYRLLSSDGSVSQVDADWVSAAENVTIKSVIEMHDLPATQDSEAPEGETPGRRGADNAIIEFQSVGDGRGFSLAAELKEDNRFERPLYASGKLIPDQLSLAFQCGFDGVVLDEDSWAQYGESAWLLALTPVVDKGYLQSRWTAIDSIWRRRDIVAA